MAIKTLLVADKPTLDDAVSIIKEVAANVKAPIKNVYHGEVIGSTVTGASGKTTLVASEVSIDLGDTSIDFSHCSVRINLVGWKLATSDTWEIYRSRGSTDGVSTPMEINHSPKDIALNDGVLSFSFAVACYSNSMSIFPVFSYEVIEFVV